MELQKSMAISAAGLKAQSTRMRIISENLANQDSLANGPNDAPYRRKTITFRNVLDRTTGLSSVKVNRVGVDNSQFGQRYMPGHPAANAQGYVQTPNVNSIVESTDMREAQRSYEANLNAIEASKQLVMRTIDLLR